MIVQENFSWIDTISGALAGMKMKKAKAKIAAAAILVPSIKDTMQTSFPIPAPGNDNDLGPMLKMSKAEAKADLAKLLAYYKGIPSQNKLALRWGRPKGTVSKWLKEFEAAGLILRKRVDKKKQVYAN